MNNFFCNHTVDKEYATASIAHASNPLSLRERAGVRGSLFNLHHLLSPWSKRSGKSKRRLPITLLAALLLVTTGEANGADVSITISGTLYSDEGITPVSGQTVRLLVSGASQGTAITDASGNYSITTTVVGPYMPLLVYVDNGSVVGTTVTVLYSATPVTINDLHIYADHLIARQDEGGTPLDTGDMDNAKASYQDPDILYSISWPDMTVTGANTELYVAGGHFFTPFGNVTTPNMKIVGTLNAGDRVFTVSGNWDHSYGTFNYGTSTVDFTGTGTIRVTGAWWTKPFYNVTAVAAGQTTTIAYGNGIAVANVLTLGSGTLAGGEINLSLDSGTPLVTSGTTFTNTRVKYHPNNGGPINVAAAAYRDVWLAGNAATNTFNLMGDMSCWTLTVAGSGSGDTAVFDSAGQAINCNNLAIGSINPDRYGVIRLNGSVVDVSANVKIYASDTNGTNQIDAGGGTINVSGNWSNSDTFTAGTSTVNLNGVGQTVNGSTIFYNLTKTTTSADTLTFAAGSTQTITGIATLNGASDQLLSLRSSATPTQWNFNLATGASKAISYVDVQDGNASGSDSSLIDINPAYSLDSGNNVSWFGNANITVVKSSAVISDPVNGSVNPKRIPGAVVEYTIRVTNTAGAQATNITITDDLNAESGKISFLPDGYGVAGKGILVTAPSINGGLVQSLTNAIDSDQGDYSSSTVTVGDIILNAGEEAVVTFRVTIQ